MSKVTINQLQRLKIRSRNNLNRYTSAKTQGPMNPQWEKLASFGVKSSKTRQLNRYVQVQKSAEKLMRFNLSVISTLHQKRSAIDNDT